jgi:hypothetical protein
VNFFAGILGKRIATTIAIMGNGISTKLVPSKVSPTILVRVKGNIKIKLEITVYNRKIKMPFTH